MSEQRRHHQRAPLAMSATVSANGTRFGMFRVLNLSAGGALFRGARPVEVGEHVDLALTLPTGEYVNLAAVVLREGRLHSRPTFAVVFADIAATLQITIQRVVTAALEELRAAQVLVVDGREEVCHNLREKARRCGFTTFAVTTALEALHCVDAGARFRTALVNAYLGADEGSEVLRYLGERHPTIRRVLVSTTTTRFDLMSATGGMAVGAPHAILAGAWSEVDFKLALVG